MGQRIKKSRKNECHSHKSLFLSPSVRLVLCLFLSLYDQYIGHNVNTKKYGVFKKILIRCLCITIKNHKLTITSISEYMTSITRFYFYLFVASMEWLCVCVLLKVYSCKLYCVILLRNKYKEYVEYTALGCTIERWTCKWSRAHTHAVRDRTWDIFWLEKEEDRTGGKGKISPTKETKNKFERQRVKE